MLLEEATSKEQVEQALAAGDEELAEDIETLLDTARRDWERRGSCEEQEIEFEFYVTSPEFSDEIIEQSPREYDLSQIPRQTVVDAVASILLVQANRKGSRLQAPFDLGEHRGSGFSYSITPSLDCWFSDSFLPVNAEYIPTNIAEAFWKKLDSVEWCQTARLEENSGWSEGYNTYYIYAGEDGFAEWCRDVYSTYVEHELRNDPEAGLRRFYETLPQDAAQALKNANLSQEELLDLAVSYLGGAGDRADDMREEIVEYVEALRAPAVPRWDVIGTWTQTDLVAMGIIRGVLFEEAPWTLVKLLPYDLKLEGQQMRHCVGDSNMGYIRAVRSGEIEIWSLRSRSGKPRFTLEVDGSFYLVNTQTLIPASQGLRTAPLDISRAQRIKQLKGKGNRLPGFTDRARTAFKFPEEVIFWYHAFKSMNVSGVHVADLEPGIAELGERRMSLHPNPARSFDTPYEHNIHTLRDPYRYW